MVRITTKDALPYVGHLRDANGEVIRTGVNEEVRLRDGMFVEAFLEIASLLNITYTIAASNAFLMSTINGKGFGTVGGYITGNEYLIDCIRLLGSGFIFI